MAVASRTSGCDFCTWPVPILVECVQVAKENQAALQHVLIACHGCDDNWTGVMSGSLVSSEEVCRNAVDWKLLSIPRNTLRNTSRHRTWWVLSLLEHSTPYSRGMGLGGHPVFEQPWVKTAPQKSDLPRGVNPPANIQKQRWAAAYTHSFHCQSMSTGHFQRPSGGNWPQGIVPTVCPHVDMILFCGILCIYCL